LSILPGLGVGTTDHLVPFHDSMRVILRFRVTVRLPTAVHEATEAHDTPLRFCRLVPGLGLGTTDHLVPSQDSISVRVPLLEDPTATQCLTETQDTPSRAFQVVRVPWLGLGTIDQDVPSHDSISVRLTLAGVK
jgi:hypothetical protein